MLVLDDATTIFDSRVIVEYLDNASPVAKLMPQETRHRIQARRWEALADGCTDAIVAIVIEKRRPAEFQYGAWIERQQDKIERALQVDVRRSRHAQLLLRRLVQSADIAVGCCLGFLDLRLPEVEWRATLSESREARGQARAAPVVQGDRSAAGLTLSDRVGRRPRPGGQSVSGGRTRASFWPTR